MDTIQSRFQGQNIVASITGQGPTVVLLHGIPGSSHIWGQVTERLAASHRVIVPDLFGFGRSSRTLDLSHLWVDGQGAGVRALLDMLGVRQCLLVGHDYGGPVASAVLASEPARVSGLVLASTNAFGDTPIPFPLSTVCWPGGLGDLCARLIMGAPSLRMMVRQGMGKPRPAVDPRLHVGDPQQAAAIRTIFCSALREIGPRYAPVEAALASVKVPTEVLWGDKDPFFPVAHGERTARLVKARKFSVLQGAGHFLPEERPQELADAILRVTLATQKTGSTAPLPA